MQENKFMFDEKYQNARYVNQVISESGVTTLLHPRQESMLASLRAGTTTTNLLGGCDIRCGFCACCQDFKNNIPKQNLHMYITKENGWGPESLLQTT